MPVPCAKQSLRSHRGNRRKDSLKRHDQPSVNLILTSPSTITIIIISTGPKHPRLLVNRAIIVGLTLWKPRTTDRRPNDHEPTTIPTLTAIYLTIQLCLIPLHLTASTRTLYKSALKPVLSCLSLWISHIYSSSTSTSTSTSPSIVNLPSFNSTSKQILLYLFSIFILHNRSFFPHATPQSHRNISLLAWV